MESPQIYLAVDAANLKHRCTRGEDVNFAALLALAGQFGAVVESTIYLPRHSTPDRERETLLNLKEMGYTRVVSRPQRWRPDGTRKSDVDTAMTIDVWDAALQGAIDIVVLVSGDSDFVPLVERLVLRRVAVYVVGPDGHTAWELLAASTRFWHTSQLPDLICRPHAPAEPLLEAA